MTVAAALVERLVAASQVGGHDRGRARDWLERHGLPDPRSEAWRSMPLEDIVATLATATATATAPTTATASRRSTDRATVDELAGRHAGTRVVFVNGRFDPVLSDPIPDGSGLWCGPASGADPTAGAAVEPGDPLDGFDALNRAAGTDLTQLRVAPERDHGTVHVVHLSMPARGVQVSHPRTTVQAGAHSRLLLIETFAGPEGTSITNAHTALALEDGAAVDHVRIQAEPIEAVHLGRTAIHQAANSKLRSTSVMLGARIARHTLQIHLGGTGARADLDGIYLPAGTQRHDLAVSVEHAASSCSSSQRYYGIADDHGHGSFGGHILVRPDTVETDAHQLNRNLVLSTTAQADTRPWLEILADDVRCTHGATVGQLDDDALFYLRSRGIPHDRARALLIEGFASEIVEAIRPDTVREHVAAALATREALP